MEQTLESKLNSFNVNSNKISVSDFVKNKFHKKLYSQFNVIFQNDNSQILSIHERLDKLEKTYDIANNTKLQK